MKRSVWLQRETTPAHIFYRRRSERFSATTFIRPALFVDPYRCRFDFSHFSAVTPEELEKIEMLVNDWILSGIPVVTEELPIEEARKKGAMALFGEKYGDIVRVVQAGDVSTEFCGGTHLDNTAKAGLFKIISETSVASGVRRIEAVTGYNVLSAYDQTKAMVTNIAQVLKNSKPLRRNAEVRKHDERDARYAS